MSRVIVKWVKCRFKTVYPTITSYTTNNKLGKELVIKMKKRDFRLTHSNSRHHILTFLST